MTYEQYANPPFGTQPQTSGLGGNETGGDFLGGPQPSQTGAESLGSQKTGGAHYLDAGTTAYTDRFAILSGNDGSSRTGSTGTALSSDSPSGIGNYDDSGTGIGLGGVTNGSERI